MLKPIFLLLLLTSSSAIFAKQKFYKWTDENGITHYSKDKPEDLKIDEVDVNTNQPEVTSKPQKQIQSEGKPEKSYLVSPENLILATHIS